MRLPRIVMLFEKIFLPIPINPRPHQTGPKAILSPWPYSQNIQTVLLFVIPLGYAKNVPCLSSTLIKWNEIPNFSTNRFSMSYSL